jgi:hypothetical protein
LLGFIISALHVENCKISLTASFRRIKIHPLTLLIFIGDYFMNGYITAQEASEKWNVTVRQVQIWCKDKKINGARMLSRIWIIPEDAERPFSKKNKAYGNMTD